MTNRWVNPSTIRADLIGYLWKGTGLPTRLPDSVAHSFGSVEGAASWDRYTVANVGGRGTVSYFDWVAPTAPSNGRAIFLMTGNSGDWSPTGYAPMYAMTQAVLAAGYYICGLAIPGRGPNPDPEMTLIGGVPTPITAGGTVSGGYNTNYQPLDSDEGTPSPTRLIEPAIVAINQIKSTNPELTICMFGHSGGGWTAEMVSAIDLRITHSISLMGGFPWGLHDWAWLDDGSVFEPGTGYIQWHLNPYMHHGSMHMDRHRMRASNNRRAVCLMADGDTVYGTTGWHVQLTSFVEQCNQRIALFGPGEFAVVYDTLVHEHTISSQAISLAIDDIDDYLARRGT